MGNGSQAELLPRLPLPTANTLSAEQKHGELIMRHLISFPVKGGRWYKAVCPPHQSLSALLERTPGCLETIQTPARVFITPQRAAAWVTCGIHHHHPREPNQQTSEADCSRSPGTKVLKCLAREGLGRRKALKLLN